MVECILPFIIDMMDINAIVDKKCHCFRCPAFKKCIIPVVVSGIYIVAQAQKSLHIAVCCGFKE